MSRSQVVGKAVTRLAVKSRGESGQELTVGSRMIFYTSFLFLK
jgi:hypothetical protein